MTDKPRLTVIDGVKDTPRQKAEKLKRARPDAAHMLSCHRCGSREVIETKIGMIFKSGKAQGGTKQILCASCLMRGERVVLC
jgi:hypothetical protein